MKVIFVAVATLAVVTILVLAIRRSSDEHLSKPSAMGRPISSSTASQHTGNDEQILREAHQLGVIDNMPDDPEAFMEKVEPATRFAEEWAAKTEQVEGVVGSDGCPVYSQLYPDAVEHYVRANGRELGTEDRLDVAKAAKHFESYWRARGEFPQDENGNPDWFIIYGQIQDHFRQWVNGKIKG